MGAQVQQLWLVEDSRADAALVKVLLSHSLPQLETRHFMEAESCWEAMSREGLPLLILIDMNLPRQGGLSFVQELRSQGHRLPVVLMSGSARRDEAVFAAEAGANGFLEKIADLNAWQVTLEATIRPLLPSMRPA